MPKSRKKPRRNGKGATLRLNGNVFNITFRHPQRTDPKTKYDKVVKMSLKTGDRSIANHYKEALDRIIRNPAYWEHPPADTPERVRQIWFGDRLDIEVSVPGKDATIKLESLPGQSKKLIAPSMGEFFAAAASANPASFLNEKDKEATLVDETIQAIYDFSSTAPVDFPEKSKLDALAVSFSRLQDHLYFVEKTGNALNERIKVLDAQNADLEQRNQVLHIRLQQYEKRKIKESRVGTLRETYKLWDAELRKAKGNNRWKASKRSLVKRFIAAMGEEKNVTEVSESDVATYITCLVGAKGQRLSALMHKRTREAACSFMEFATHKNFNRKLIKPVSASGIKRESKDIIWLTKAEVESMIAKIPKDPIHGLYWRDIARIQVSMGWRPSELLILQAQLASEDIVTLAVVRDTDTGEMIGKTGGRSVKVPSKAKAALKRRLKVGHELLFPRLTRSGSRKRRGLLKEAWLETTFYMQFREILRTAAKAAGITKEIDSRTFRRTFGSLMLRAGKTLEEVAELMGDKPGTIRRHYARILAHEIDTEV